MPTSHCAWLWGARAARDRAAERVHQGLSVPVPVAVAVPVTVAVAAAGAVSGAVALLGPRGVALVCGKGEGLPWCHYAALCVTMSVVTVCLGVDACTGRFSWREGRGE